MSDFVNSDDTWSSEKSRQNLSECIQFFFLQYLKSIKNRFFLVKKWEIQVILSIIMLIRSLERVFIPMRYTGFKCELTRYLKLHITLYPNPFIWQAIHFKTEFLRTIIFVWKTSTNFFNVYDAVYLIEFQFKIFSKDFFWNIMR